MVNIKKLLKYFKFITYLAEMNGIWTYDCAENRSFSRIQADLHGTSNIIMQKAKSELMYMVFFFVRNRLQSEISAHHNWRCRAQMKHFVGNNLCSKINLLTENSLASVPIWTLLQSKMQWPFLITIVNCRTVIVDPYSTFS